MNLLVTGEHNTVNFSLWIPGEALQHATNRLLVIGGEFRLSITARRRRENFIIIGNRQLLFGRNIDHVLFVLASSQHHDGCTPQQTQGYANLRTRTHLCRLSRGSNHCDRQARCLPHLRRL